MKRLYVVVRDDLPPGLQMAQACHAAFEFGRFTEADVGDNLVVLHASRERICELAGEAFRRGLQVLRFDEPDLGGETTAVALEGDARPLVSSLPLAMRKPACTIPVCPETISQ